MFLICVHIYTLSMLLSFYTVIYSHFREVKHSQINSKIRSQKGLFIQRSQF